MGKHPLSRETILSVLPALLIPMLGALAYLPAFRAGWVFDDHAIILGNALLRGPLGNVWRSTTIHDFWPLTWTGFWAQWQIWGDQAAGYHAVNILLHIAVSLLLWRVLEALRVPGAWFAGILFAVHPVTVESVAWVSEQKNTLSGVLYLITVLVWLRMENRPPSRRIPVCLLLFALALLAKASVVMLPVVLLGIALHRRGTLGRKEWLETAPLFALGFLFGLVNIWFQRENVLMGGWGPQRDLWERIGGTGWALLAYQRTAFVPVRLSFFYPEWPVSPASFLFYLPVGALLALFFLLWAFRKRVSWAPPVLYALAYHALLLLPILGLLEIAYFQFGPVSNHLQYLALMGPVALVAYGVTRVYNRLPVVAFALAAGLALFLSVSTHHRSSAFRDDITFWSAVVKDSPRNALARNNLAAFLLDQGRRSEALEQLEAAANVSRTPAERHRYRSQWHLYSGRKEEAVAEARQAIRSGGGPEVRHQAARVLGAAGQVEESIEVYRTLVREIPSSSTYSYELGAALARSGRLPEAADVLRRYCGRRPGVPGMEEALALTLLRMGLREEARERAAVVMGVDPADPRAGEQLARWERNLPNAPPSPAPDEGGARAR